MAHEMVLQNTFRKMFPVREEVLNVSAENSSRNQPTTFHPNRIAEVPRRFLLPLFVNTPALQYHLFRNGAVLMYNDSKIDPSQASPNSTELSVEKTFALVVDGSRNFRELFSVPWEDFVLHGTTTLHTGDCCAIHNPQLRTL